MTVMPPEIQWYIARDGKQYGPLSDAEMGLFMRGGHLKPADLVWRPGFADWAMANIAFPAYWETASVAQRTAPASPNGSQPAAQPSQPLSQPFAPNASEASSFRASAAATRPMPANGQDVGGRDSGAGDGSGPGWSPQSSSVVTGEARQASNGPSGDVPRTGPGSRTTPSTQGGAGRSAKSGSGSVVSVEPGYPDMDAVDEPVRKGSGFRIAAIAAALLVIAGGAWLALTKRETLTSLAATMMNSAGAPKVDGTLLAFVVDASTPEAIDGRFQRTALWSVVKREFPEWYGERLQEAVKLAADKKPEAAIKRHLIEALVALRRKHANDALAASTPRLVTIAGAFLANLKQISAQSNTTCYSFISQGEASPAVIEMLQTPGTELGVQSQVTAVFEAVAEGRRTPVKHASPEKSDYDALAEQLTKLGWTQSDLQLFADPRALARTSHDRVCKMVQEWFTAHIAVKDKGSQERLLIETLRPVVAG